MVRWRDANGRDDESCDAHCQPGDDHDIHRDCHFRSELCKWNIFWQRDGDGERESRCHHHRAAFCLCQCDGQHRFCARRRSRRNVHVVNYRWHDCCRARHTRPDVDSRRSRHGDAGCCRQEQRHVFGEQCNECYDQSDHCDYKTTAGGDRLRRTACVVFSQRDGYKPDVSMAQGQQQYCQRNEPYAHASRRHDC